MIDRTSDILLELIDTINSNEKVKRMKDLKNIIYNDKELSNDLNRFKHIMNESYSDEYVSLKKKILDNKNVREYKELENELYLIILDLNNKLNSLIDRKKCLNESY